ncbi:MAG: sn-glycerol-3-phosphate ABC transporter ATP-binding protein UgpC [Clostridia bacterium]|nr:sn-glycerol-3-phosphate ABC transporter ATP-binding protein UgpC [Clostridia bacterium]
MASVTFEHVKKVYDNKVEVVHDFNLEIKDKEFIVFVGPSGCGKSTTLRMIAGLEDITAGELMIGDEVVNDVEPKDRNIAMVFQNYALYPHMTVRENMAFALRLQKGLKEEEIMARVNEAAERLDIVQFLDRKPRALSGGQRQRVSLGRAIVRHPKVFLLDEPLSNLDAKLRAQMRTEIAKLHKQLATTFIYVTHDQVEAMTMGTRIVVMKFGVVQQIDTPKNLYDYPGNKFVASFIGTPQMNFFDATLLKRGDEIEITFANGRKITVPYECLIKADDKYFDGKTVVTIGIRPEDVHIEEDFVNAHGSTAIECNISIMEALGSESIIYCELDPENDNKTDSATRLTLKVDPRKQFELDQRIKVAFDPTRIHLFDKETEVSIMPRIPAENRLKATVAGGACDIGGVKFTLPEAMRLSDGEYTFVIPSDAFVFDGDEERKEATEGARYTVPYEEVEQKFRSSAFVGAIKPLAHTDFYECAIKPDTTIPVKSTEQIGKTTLLRLAFGKDTVFAVGNASVAGAAQAKAAIDWKKVTVLSGDNEVIAALLLTNRIEGKMVKERASKKEYNFGLDVGGKIFYCTEYVQQKLFNAAGKKAFDIRLEYDFTPYSVMIAADGFDAVVERTLDYGQEKFAVVKAGDKTVNVYLPAGKQVTVGDKVKLSVDLTRLGVVEADRGIRVI